MSNWIHSHPYRWNWVESKPECATNNGNLYQWRLNAVFSLATTAFAALRAALSLLDPQSALLQKMQLSLLAFFIIIITSYHVINLTGREGFVGFTRRYLALAETLDEG